MHITIEGKSIDARPGQSLLTLLKELGLDSDSLYTRPLAADLGGEVFTLNYEPVREQDALPMAMGYKHRRAIRESGGQIRLIRYNEDRGRRVYERTLLFVFCLAARELFPKAPV